jgi:hypothetical protein
MRRASSLVLLVTGILLVFSGAAHALLGWPALRAELAQAQVPGDVSTAVAAGWLYGSGAMLTFGVLVLSIWWAGRRGRSDAARYVAPIALLYLVFGTAAFLSTRDPHFIGFIVLGGLLLFGWFGLRQTV